MANRIPINGGESQGEDTEARFVSYDGGKPMYCRKCGARVRVTKRMGLEVVARFSCECGEFLQHTFPAGWGDSEQGSTLDVEGSYQFWKKVLPRFCHNKAETVEEALADLERQHEERVNPKPIRKVAPGLYEVTSPEAVKALAKMLAAILVGDDSAICPGCGKPISEHGEEGDHASDA